MNAMESEVQRLLTAAFAPNTHKAYQTGWSFFCSFKNSRLQVITSPASTKDVREFIAWLSLRQLAPATIATYIAGVAHYHKLNGFPDPTRDFLVSKLLEGCRRGRSQADKRLPINPTFLSEIIHALSHVCVSQFESTLFRAAMLTAFF